MYSHRILFLVLLFMTNCTSTTPPKLQRLDGSRITHTQLDQRILHLMEEASVTGLAITVLNDGEAVYQKAFGYANAESGDTLTVDHIIYGASFTKAVFGYIVSRLVEEGKIELDRPLQDYLDVSLPEIPVQKDYLTLAPLRGDNRHQELTARMCLNHTTGLPNWRWIEDDKQLKFLYDPGTRYNYSGEGMMILQWVIEHITDKKLDQLAEEMVFQPLNMSRTDYLWDPATTLPYAYGHRADQSSFAPDFFTEEAAAAGSMTTTLADYSRFAEHILALEARQSPITERMFTPSVRIHSKKQFGPLSHEDTTANDDIELGYGMGWGLLTTPYGQGAFKEGHDVGFQHYSILFPGQQLGVILMTNSDNGESIFKYLLEVSIADTFTPWEWEHYLPYDQEEQ